MKNYKHKIIFKLLLFKFTKLNFGATSKYKFKQNLKMSMQCLYLNTSWQKRELLS